MRRCGADGVEEEEGSGWMARGGGIEVERR
jgi:hypothetical protein